MNQTELKEKKNFYLKKKKREKRTKKETYRSPLKKPDCEELPSSLNLFISELILHEILKSLTKNEILKSLTKKKRDEEM